ncbi:MAG TPA: hypothetical protein VH442_18345 [Micromonosporaceae bacterium]
MDEGRHVGKAPVARHVGRAKVATAKAPKPPTTTPKVPAAGTSVMAAPPKPVPVFVDDSGWRRRRLRTVIFALAVLTVLATAAVWLSVTIAPVRPAPLGPCVSATAPGSAGCGQS